ncbi:FkbM family methyltransferase [Roseobacter sp. HKCCD9010]|uniref:FkbM family methyltransferase n=1 Tax=unclassified Roseobacter TaxID=196798 RepID=UPI001492D585|nr:MULTISPECIES: FkbM family methyltransferase [unclassified Roseobacter]MBF9049684.1 FkbM family methyltransferase [Rhodobacterales bacterium HKCCD4356]NNV11684.1 FkbM family methyltransferase [Roseobacter sp. HKCCD7357]NNV15868.1 FkbM family methyltransferase [Roseobacter sp. HKCCD8768]NNV25328.1 FkbM family methyltransferase [Roseobacter sp. HKCCD8192]NNV29585.1 FkbM family methyltransferase [Roseobacter sp. HKCCD9061]
MADPFRNLRLYWHRMMKTSLITMDGVRVHADADRVPRPVRNGLFKGTYEDAERALMARVLKSGCKVLEIGGGIGLVGLIAARIAGSGQVTSYEANPLMKPMIEANYALNSIAPDLRMKAITVDGKPVSFHQSDNVISSSLYQRAETQTTVTVESDALADVLVELAPDVVIMDVEGAEIDLLANLSLDGVKALVVELHPHIVGQQKIDNLLASLAERGFETTGNMRNNVLLERAVS